MEAVAAVDNVLNTASNAVDALFRLVVSAPALDRKSVV